MHKNKQESSFLSKFGRLFRLREGANKLSARVEPNLAEPVAKDPIRLDMEVRLRKAGRPLPTEDQWRMILAKAATTRVVAGAGSGKSTTLVLRVMVLAHYHKIPWSFIRVVTFTRNSRADFIEKLCATAGIWDMALNAKQASAIVRTFHSLAFAQAKAAGLNVTTLDQIDGGSGTESGAAPFASLTVDGDSGLAKALHETASTLMKESPSFAQVISDLYGHSFLVAGGFHLEDSKVGRLSAVKSNDYDRTLFMHKLWQEKIAPDLMKSDLIDFSMDTFTTGALHVAGREVEAHGPWWANAFIPKLNAWLILGAGDRYVRGQRMPDGFPVGPAIGAKKSCVNVLTSNANVIWVNTPDELAALHVRLKWSPGSDEAFPKFGIRLTGEVGSTPLLVAFWQQAQFIQSLGIDVAQAADDSAKHTGGVDALFAKALSLFWPAFKEVVAEKGYTLSNEIFSTLSDPLLLQRLPDSAILGIQHLLVDEFQDISGLIVNWLNAVRSEIVRRGLDTSLMVVGDDWQSIYGWRGASPTYFTDFFNRFPSSGGGQETVYLSENFRSSQMIVDAASQAISMIHEKIEKVSVAKGQYAALDEPIELAKVEDDLDPETALVSEYLAHGSVFVLSRTRSALVPFKEAMVRAMTIHGSKGLEADYVLLIDDFAPPSTHPLRCCWYARADLGDYDQAQADETLRLVYVAITRAKKGCRWIIRGEVDDGVFLRLADTKALSIQALEVCCGR